METKICTACKQDKLISEFAWRNKQKKKVQTRCNPCRKAAAKVSYTNNRKVIISRVVDRQRSIAQKLKEYKATQKCERCGQNHPATLDFHHHNKKEFEVGNMRGWSWKSIFEEIKKCTILCANCHRIEHFVK